MVEAERIASLCDDELRRELSACGSVVGPITDSTRSMWKKRLLQTITGTSNTDESCVANDTVATNDIVCTNDAGKTNDIDNANTASTSDANDTTDKNNTDDKGGTGDAGGDTGDDGTSNTSSDCSSQDSPPASDVSTYFAVSLPQKLLNLHAITCSKSSLVFSNRLEALMFMKKAPGSRFKVFTEQQDAEDFSALPTEQLVAQPITNGKPSSGESLAFSGPKTQDLTKMRKMIERGQEAEFHTLIWSNPRYLLSSGEGPVIVQEACRFNALHTAASRNQPHMAQIILDTLNDSAFMEKLHTNDSPETRNMRIAHHLDLYLNMPEKGNNETPLHFACKFASLPLVRIFLSQPAVDRQAVNKYGQTPQQIIGTRAREPSADVNRKIEELFDENVFVPLLRASDNCTPPLIGRPWSPGVDSASPMDSVKPLSPKDPTYKLRALAGPMSPSKAKRFWEMWRKSKNSKRLTSTGGHNTGGIRETTEHIRCSDENKGMERIGRDLAEDLSVPWCEYWDFLEGFADLNTEEGMGSLEQYLCDVELESSSSSDDDMFDCSDILNVLEHDVENDLNSSLTMQTIQNVTLPDLMKHSSTPIRPQTTPAQCSNSTDSASSADYTHDMVNSAHDGSLGNGHVPESATPTVNDRAGAHLAGAQPADPLSPVGELGKLFAELTINSPTAINNDLDKVTDNSDKDDRNDGGNVFGNVRDYTDGQTSDSRETTNIVPNKLPMKVSDWLCNNSYSERNDTFELSSHLNDDQSQLNSSSASDDSFITAAESVQMNDWSPPFSKCVFIHGDTPTKDDLDLLRVLENSPVSHHTFPHVAKWKSNVLAQSENSRKEWTSPSRLQRSSRRRSAQLSQSLLSNVSSLSTMDTSDNSDIRSNLLASFLSE